MSRPNFFEPSEDVKDQSGPVDDLSDFKPTSPRNRLASTDIDQIAHQSGFPSRPVMPSPKAKTVQRRHRTGRNRQLNIKASDATILKINAILDAKAKDKLLLCELLEHMLEAYEREQASKEG